MKPNPRLSENIQVGRLSPRPPSACRPEAGNGVPVPPRAAGPRTQFTSCSCGPKLRSILAFLCLGVLVGCLNLDPKPDPTRFYVLTGAASTETNTSDCSRTVLIGPVRVAGSLDQPAIVERVSDTEVRFLEWHRWAEPLVQGIPRSLIPRLATRLPGNCVLAFQRATPGTNSIQIEVEIDRFELAPDNRATLTARWRILNPAPGDQAPTIGAGTFSTSFEAGTNRVAAGVAGLSATLDQLAERIARDLPDYTDSQK